MTPTNATFHGRQAIEKGYAQLDLGILGISAIIFTTVDRVIAVGNEVQSTLRKMPECGF